jgi:hypothetical protein
MKTTAKNEKAKNGKQCVSAASAVSAFSLSAFPIFSP